MWGCDVHNNGFKSQPIHRHAIRYLMLSLLYMMHMHSSTVNSMSSPIALFAPPPQLLQQRPMAMERAVQFDYRSSHQKSSIQEPVVTNKMTGHKRNNPRSMPKIKSPSNSYTQFYKEGILVGIERTSPNSRRISGEIIMDIPIDAIWNILTDYDNLSTHVPNLVESKVINNGRRIVGGRPRVYQRGAQSIFGFEFGADVTMDMTERILHSQPHDDFSEPRMYSIDFECVDSQFFSKFDGSWILEEYSTSNSNNAKTMVRYIVDVGPKGPVPVAALEWRIKEDVPVNILAVSKSARAASARQRKIVQNIKTEQEVVEPMPAISEKLGRPIETQSNPLQRLTDQAANNLKRTAKSFLPSPVFSRAKRAIKAISGSTSTRRASTSPIPTMTLYSGKNGNDIGGSVKSGTAKRAATNGKMNSLSSRSSIVDWYEDETLAMYVKDP